MNENQITPPDEINLQDILKTILHQKKLIGMIILLSLIVGVIAIFVRQPTFIYRQVIVPAYYFAGDSKISLDSSEDITSLITQVWLPTFVNQYNASHPDDKLITNKQFSISVGSPKFSGDGGPAAGSMLIYLEMEGSLKKQPLFTEFIHFIGSALQSSQIERIRNMQKETKQQIDSLEKILPTSTKTTSLRNNILSINDQDAALNIGNLETRLFNLQLKLSTLRESKFLLETTLIIPVKMISPIAVILLSLFCGLIAGIFLAFLRENWTRVTRS